MARFFADIHDRGSTDNDDVGFEAVDSEAATRQVVRALAEIAQVQMPDETAIHAILRDDQGPILTIDLVLNLVPAAHRLN